MVYDLSNPPLWWNCDVLSREDSPANRSILEIVRISLGQPKVCILNVDAAAVMDDWYPVPISRKGALALPIGDVCQNRQKILFE